MTTTITNADRAGWAADTLRYYQHTNGTNDDSALADLLCDLMHWTSANDFDFDAALCRVRGYHKAEVDAAETPPDTIAIKWSIEDVHETRPDLTEAQCCNVLAAILDRHDATIGVTWDVLTIVANDLYPAA